MAGQCQCRAGAHAAVCARVDLLSFWTFSSIPSCATHGWPKSVPFEFWYLWPVSSYGMRGGSEDKVLRACHKICYRLTTAAFLGKDSFCVQRSWRRSRAWSPPMKFSWRRGGGAFHLGSTVPWEDRHERTSNYGLRKLAHVDWNGLAARHGSYSMFLPCFYMYYVTLSFQLPPTGIGETPHAALKRHNNDNKTCVNMCGVWCWQQVGVVSMRANNQCSDNWFGHKITYPSCIPFNWVHTRQSKARRSPT